MNVPSDEVVRLHLVSLTRAFVSGCLTADEFVQILSIFIKGLRG